MRKIRGDVICQDCGTLGIYNIQTSGSIWLELLLYIVGAIAALPTFFVSLLIPFVYSIHRRSVSVKVCKKCGGKEINIYTPKGEKLLNKLQVQKIQR